MFLHDFSFKPPEQVLAEIGAGHGAGGHGDHGAGVATPGRQTDAMAGMDHGSGRMMPTGNMPMGGMMGMGGMSGMAMDLNDYDWDAYLANDRTLSDPEVVRVERGGRVRLRVINAAAATVFWIDTGTAEARLVALDGHAVQPLAGFRFGLAMGQRLDLEIDLPNVTLRRGPSDGARWVMVSPTLWSTLRSHRTSRSCPPRTCRGVGTGAMRTRSGWSRKATGDIGRFLRPPVGTAFRAGC